MIKTILHQIWNERRQNGWLFVELVAIVIFLWIAIDPLFILFSNSNILKGYNDDNVYFLTFEPKRTNQLSNGNVAEECANDFVQAVNIIRAQPEVESYGVASSNNFPNSMSNNCPMYEVDSIMNVNGENHSMHIITYDIYDFPGSDYFATFQIRDVNGEIMRKSSLGNGYGVYVSENLAQKAFGTTDVVGKIISYPDEKESINVAGIFSTLQTMKYIEPMYQILRIHDRSEISQYIDKSYIFENYRIFFRLKKGIDVEAFMQRFRDEVAPKLDFNYRKCSMPAATNAAVEEYENMFGISNRYRVQMILSGFALFCAFLGVMSTYWVRVSSRRMDIGLMRSVGATHARILWQFVFEGWLIVTFAFVAALPLLLHKVSIMGFSAPLEKLTSMLWEELILPKNSAYIHNQPVTHFAIVTVISYLFMLLVAAIGIIIPTIRIASILPSEALKE